ncbi:MAG: recombinase RecQ [Flavobacteriaceae bacterium]|nr:recombinase RecQ [Flavobacteriaceae bacterium]
MKKGIYDILKIYWNALEFLPGQKKAINAILDNKDCLVVLQTGGGKSLCYQLPTLTKPGLCVVISPLIALMNDQVEGLKKKGIRAMNLSGPMREDDLVNALDNCKFGEFKFLYLSPERAQHPLVQDRLSEIKLCLLAIDEAHCISEWGHDFRPAYREIIGLKNKLSNTPTIALTATANKRVKEDICKALELKHPVRITDSFDRPNIEIKVLKTVNKLEDISKALEPKGTPAIVYAGTRKSVELLSVQLNNLGHQTNFFHGSAIAKEKRLANWIQEKTPVMVATSAFSMGIDKSNVQRVVHATLPFSMEQYYQEIGRCGRDGSAAKATLLIKEGDEQKLWNITTVGIPSVEAIKKTYKHLCHYFDIAYGEKPDDILEFNHILFCDRYELKHRTTYNVLKVLERGQLLTLTQYNKPKTSLKLLHKHIKQDHRLVNYLLRNIGGITDRFQNINLDNIALKSGVGLSNAIECIKQLQKQGDAEVQQLYADSGIIFHVPREDKISLMPVLRQLNTLGEEKKRLAVAVWKYATTDICYRKKLLNYFGETYKKNCDNCSNCVIKEVL